VEAARILERCVRDVDLVARTGADEYAVVLMHTDSTGARKAAERIRRVFESHLFLVREGLDLRITLSIGVAACPEHAKAPDALMEAAEMAVDAARSGSRNCVVVAGG
jgi:diguanylate cyclase (GGDEF)-like protein